MHVIIWQYTVREEYVKKFISSYGTNGDWANLFRRAAGYLSTQLLRSSECPNVFLTIDRWESATCFENFQARFCEEYKRLDAQFEIFTLTENKIGVFSETYKSS
jgi:heme-degrading monooxygenase HmoA